MLIHKCTKCSKIFRFSSMPGPSESRCTECRGQIVCIGQDDLFLAKGQLKREEPKNKKINWPFLLDTVKTLGTAWEVGGAVNLVNKYIKNQEVGNGGLAHVVVPSVLVEMVN